MSLFGSNENCREMIILELGLNQRDLNLYMTYLNGRRRIGKSCYCYFSVKMQTNNQQTKISILRDTG